MYKIGDIIEGTVTGVQPYGIFVSLGQDEQGLIHISECTHGYIQNVQGFLTLGQTVRAMVIDVDEYTKKISLSLRALEKIPVPKQVVRKKRRRDVYTNQLGFETLRQKLPEWIDEAQELINQQTHQE
ncbi:S1 RNA-binding domain-containing protein [Granulicatella sp. zg-ZJ]|uniref:CvfD/Ygs/GSP13 family RNA-binding post-transcriptional regulator n=1 Tax=unclassified Granulicatella TaxID=2630493 RepID=UPI0013BEEE16|nr:MULTISPECIES: CvfD/Ygs/GSP13 family RNA-binding post-transcriptional regulator [unclassified Granulicatella]MBS4750204.1 S1 RNA-binding domain-containing protein [Carnobacteriaceae bacterium zg-ZUI78]NEW63324.1 S1 RNA-binding domain-containing protein [Granulicatella sp. zg-ZJ]NEW66937.1 S1 RNA-binding domain-containing protein [Granulicatella sp. zg-84]QMI85659.1 S1 RNA-binding domain-containing protein [Carnobacteriaceae bacterium zg-84]